MSIRIANDSELDVGQSEITTEMMGPTDAVARFIYWLGIAPPERIRFAYQNFQTLPFDDNRYVIVTDVGRRRVGRSCEKFDPIEDVINLYEYTEITLQIDIFDPILEMAIENAQKIDTIALTEHGVNFFKRYGLSCLYADDVRPSSTEMEDGLFIGRATTTLYLGAWFKVAIPSYSFDSVELGASGVVADK